MRTLRTLKTSIIASCLISFIVYSIIDLKYHIFDHVTSVNPMGSEKCISQRELLQTENMEKKIKKSAKADSKFACMWPPDQTRNVSLLTRPGLVTTVIQMPGNCGGNTSSPQLLVMVQSAPASFQARSNVRETWAKNAQKTDTKVAFLLGQSLQEDDDLEQNIRREAEEFGDIIQEDFVDSWTNLTIKSLMMLKWFDQNCNLDQHSDNIKYLMKVDEDVYVNLPELMKVLHNYSVPNLLLGSIMCDPNPDRHKKGRHIKYKLVNAKYHTSGQPDCIRCWPGCQFHQPKRPPRLNGPAYIMDAQTAKRLYKASLDVTLIGFEDIFVTGVLAKKLNIRPIDDHRFRLGPLVKRKTKKAIKANACYVLAAHLKNEELREIHASVEKQMRKGCERRKEPRNTSIVCQEKYFNRTGMF